MPRYTYSLYVTLNIVESEYTLLVISRANVHEFKDYTAPLLDLLKKVMCTGAQNFRLVSSARVQPCCTSSGTLGGDFFYKLDFRGGQTKLGGQCFKLFVL